MITSVSLGSWISWIVLADSISVAEEKLDLKLEQWKRQNIFKKSLPEVTDEPIDGKVNGGVDELEELD